LLYDKVVFAGDDFIVEGGGLRTAPLKEVVLDKQSKPAVGSSPETKTVLISPLNLVVLSSPSIENRIVAIL
jgi:hypothetical protein